MIAEICKRLYGPSRELAEKMGPKIQALGAQVVARLPAEERGALLLGQELTDERAAEIVADALEGGPT